MTALCGAKGHSEGTEEDEIEREDQVSGKREIREHLRPEDGRHEQQQADTAGEAEHRPEVEHDAVRDRAADAVVLDQVDIVLPDRNAVAASDARTDFLHQCRQQETVIDDDEERQQRVGDHDPFERHASAPRPEQVDDDHEGQQVDGIDLSVAVVVAAQQVGNCV